MKFLSPNTSEMFKVCFVKTRKEFVGFHEELDLPVAYCKPCSTYSPQRKGKKLDILKHDALVGCFDISTVDEYYEITDSAVFRPIINIMLVEKRTVRPAARDFPIFTVLCIQKSLDKDAKPFEIVCPSCRVQFCSYCGDPHDIGCLTCILK